MSNEELEKRMEFIIEHQAQFAANIQAHDERFTRLEQHVGQIGEHVGQLEELVNRLAAATLAGFKDVNAKIDALVDSQIRISDAQTQMSDAQTQMSDAQARMSEAQARMSEAQARLAEAQARTEESQARTDEALRKLIAVVDRYFDERRDGEQK